MFVSLNLNLIEKESEEVKDLYSPTSIHITSTSNLYLIAVVIKWRRKNAWFALKIKYYLLLLNIIKKV